MGAGSCCCHCGLEPRFPCARTTPRTRAETNASPAGATALASLYNITAVTARKWKGRKDIDAVTRDEAGKLSVSLRGRAGKLAVSRLYAHLFKAM